MRTGIGKLLQIEEGNRPLIAALLIQGLCTGVFAGILELEANACSHQSYK
jgi:hypothetical protein